MCPQCQAEYNDPRDRRFHAQPNACPVCGPQLELWDRKGKALPSDERRSPETSRGAISAAAEAIRQGQIVAVKGLGGFHLMVAAHNDEAVRRLRELKHREEKPFALMFPSLPAIKAACEVSPLEERLLRSPEAPIVLLRRRQSRNPHIRIGTVRLPRPGQPQPRRDAPLHPAASPAHVRARVPRRRHQRQPERRADLHRRARSARTPGRHRRSVPRPQPAHRPARGRLHRARDDGARAGPAPRPRLRPSAHPAPLSQSAIGNRQLAMLSLPSAPI